ncbi:MAG TPA: metallopeptidase TldD-related protein, partial [Actinomycetota bacterium]|nr:metallopeptidase TldD-related protein [Actinomycetota bacterium]
TPTTNGVAEGAGLTIVSIVGRRVGVIARNHFPDDGLEDLVRESEAACEGKPEAEDYMPLLEGTAPAGDWSAPAATTDITVFDRFTPQLAGMFDRAGAADVNTYGYAEHTASTVWLATSSGVRARDHTPSGRVEVTAKSTDFARSAWAGVGTADFTDVRLGTLFDGLAQRLQWSERKVEVPAGKYEVVLQPAAVADMLIYMYWSSSARDADEGRTVFHKTGGGNRLGEKMFAGGVNVYSDPAEPGLTGERFVRTAGSSSYSSVFDNGLPTRRVDWVHDGALNALVTTRHWAARSDGEPAPLISNLVFPAEGRSLEEMVAETERGLLVTCFWYIRAVDPQTLLLTGLTRDGVFLVEGGEVVGAANNFRYNMSPVAMLAQTTEIGRSAPTLPREFEEFGLTKMPPIRVADFNMSSISEAT